MNRCSMSKKLRFVGSPFLVALVAGLCLVSSGCKLLRGSKTWPYPIEVKLGENLGRMQVDLIGIKENEMASWSGTNVDKYWSEKKELGQPGRLNLVFLENTVTN